MKVLIDIPTKNFGVDITNKFQDFFQRLQVETKEHLISNTNLVCGSYELETIEMFLNAFEKMQIIPDNATNGDMLLELLAGQHDRIHPVGDTQMGITLDCEWWNAPYKRGDSDSSN